MKKVDEVYNHLITGEEDLEMTRLETVRLSRLGLELE
jgi:hypothetical protein